MKKVLLLILCCLMTVLTVSADNQKTANLPEWFYKISPGNRIGAIGFSYKYTADSSVSAVQIARLNAISSLKNVIGEAEYETGKDILFDLVLGNLTSATFASGTLTVGGSYVEGVSVFEYIYFEPGNATNTSNDEKNYYSPTCNFEKCQPGWLCNQVNGDRAGFLGISYTASSPGRQFEITAQNALEIIQYMLGVDIEGKERYYRLNSSAMKINYRHKSFSINKSTENSEAFIYTKAQCFAGNTLFSWKVSNDIPAYPTASSREWLTSGKVGDLEGAVGTANKDLTGFVSRQLKNAYEDGIAELSKTDKVKIQSEDIIDYGNQKNRYSESSIKIDYESSLKPRISGIYMDEQERMHVWVTADSFSDNSP